MWEKLCRDTYTSGVLYPSPPMSHAWMPALMESQKLHDQTSVRTELVGVMINLSSKRHSAGQGWRSSPLERTNDFCLLTNGKIYCTQVHEMRWFWKSSCKECWRKKKNGNRTCNETANLRSILKLKWKLFAFDSIHDVLLKEKNRKGKGKKRKKAKST